MELKRDLVMAVSFEVSPDMPGLTRDNYTVLDVMSDVGGLAEVLFRAISMVLAILNYNHLQSFLTKSLFKVRN